MIWAVVLLEINFPWSHTNEMNGMDVYRDMTLFSFIDMCTLGKISSPLKAHMVTKYKSRVQILMKVSEQ